MQKVNPLSRMKSRDEITERRLVDVLTRYIRKTHRAQREVPVYERRVDIAAVCCDTNELWTIEAKIADWGRALSQAVVNLAAGEKSFIAIYSKYVNTIPLDKLERYGIGLISVGTKWDDVKLIHDARKSRFVNNLVAVRIKSRIKP